MNRPLTYTQCRLQRGSTQMVSWLPSIFAVRNRYLKLKVDGEWQEGWKVTSVGAEVDEQYLKEHGDDYRNQREASDV